MTPQELLNAMESLVAKAATLNGKRWRGDWERSVAYSVNDMVIHKGRNYMSLTNLNRNHPPVQDPSSIYWAEMTPAIVAPTSAPGDTGTLTPGPLLVPKSTTNGYLDKGWLPPGLNPSVQYVAPGGDDTANGFEWHSAKRTSDAALTYLVSKGGGELHYAEGIHGNIWLRGDGLSVPGFYPEIPLRVVGHGKVASQFGNEPMAWLEGGAWTGGGRLTPLIWLSACNSQAIVLENITPSAGGVPGIGLNNQTMRLGWDYRRKADGAIDWANVTQWHRTAGGPSGSATLTLALPAATPMVSAVRTGSTVRVTWASKLPLPADVSAVTAREQWVYINSTDPAYASGSFQVTAIDPSGTETLWFEYTDASSGSTTPMSPLGTYQSSGVCIDDRIEVVSTEPNVPSCMYKVTGAASATSITVRDVYGYGPRASTGTWNNIGQYVLQDRSTWYASSLYTIRNCAGASSTVAPDRFENGPSVDVGSALDGRVLFDRTNFNGMGDAVTACNDQDRVAWMLQDGGVRGTPAAILRGDRPNGGGCRMYGSNTATWGLDAKDVQGDVGVGADAQPTVEILNGNAAGILYCDNVRNADADPSVPNVKYSNMFNADVRVINCGYVDGRGYVEGGIATTLWATKTVAPQTVTQYGFWQFGRIAGIHEAAYRPLGGLATARYKSKVLDPGSWTLAGGTITAGQVDPDGGTGAVRLQHAGSMASVYSGSNVIATGDRMIFACKMRRPGGIAAGPSGVLTVAASPAVPGWTAIANVEFKGDGEWQLVYCIGVASSGVTSTLSAEIGVNSDVYVYAPTMILIPAADMTDNEFYQYVQTFRAQPNYLPAGTDGTHAGRKFHADGGLVVGVSGYASGTVALFDGASAAVSTAGSGALRYNAGTNKIQYSKNGGAWTDLV